MEPLSVSDLKSILADQSEFTGGTGHYYQAKQGYMRLKSEHELMNKQLLKSDSAKKMILI